MRARLDAQFMARSIGLRIEMFWHHSKRVYVLWPNDGFAWEIADPPVATTFAGIDRVLRLIHANLTAAGTRVGGPSMDGDLSRLSEDALVAASGSPAGDRESAAPVQ